MLSHNSNLFSGRTWRRGGAVCPRLPPPCDLLRLLHVLHVSPALLLLQPARLRHHVHVLHGLHHGHVHVPRAACDDDLQIALLPCYHTAKNEPLPLHSATRTQVKFPIEKKIFFLIYTGDLI